jgi:hypothetical protein
MKRKENPFSIASWQSNQHEQLYSKLQLQNEQQRDEFTRLNDDYTKLKEYLFRFIYKKVFDQLELGIIPDSLELQNYFRPIDNNFWIYGDWTLLIFQNQIANLQLLF